MIGQSDRAPAARHRLPATTAFRRKAHGGVADRPKLNWRRFLRGVFTGLSATADVSRQQPGRPSSVPDAPPIIREPEGGWWEHDDCDAAMTVAVVGDTGTRAGTEAMVSRLAELAVHDELLIVYGAGAWSPSGHHAVLAGLRGHLPRHHLVTVHVDVHRGGLRRDAAAALAQFVEDGSLPVVVTPAAAVPGVAAEISSYLRADRVLRVAGADLQHVWRRRAPATVG